MNHDDNNRAKLGVVRKTRASNKVGILKVDFAWLGHWIACLHAQDVDRYFTFPRANAPRVALSIVKTDCNSSNDCQGSYLQIHPGDKGEITWEIALHTALCISGWIGFYCRQVNFYEKHSSTI